MRQVAENRKVNVEEAAEKAMKEHKGNGKQFVIWIAALIVGAVLGWQQIPALDALFNFVASVFTRLFQFIAVPTIALAVITTLSMLGAKRETGRIFAHAVTYTMLTTIAAAAVGLGLYLWIAPGNLPADAVGAGAANVPQNLGKLSYYDHFLSVIPNNLLQPFIAGNVLSVLIIAAMVGLGLAFMPKSENRDAL
ncbi:MAG: cation:dicarboxylase symporter family transporter, partial [Schwartzia sp.]|nr:cation:dicarboxylase symporter family transporter [Schwartzia sp. (in: firmicutes)]